MAPRDGIDTQDGFRAGQEPAGRPLAWCGFPGEYDRWRDEHTWDPSRGTDLVIQEDLAPAAWIEPRLVPGSFEVQMTTPRGFEAYARVLFPFPGEGAGQEFISWTETARRSGRTAHALMEAETILSGYLAGGGQRPASGRYSRFRSSTRTRPGQTVPRAPEWTSSTIPVGSFRGCRNGGWTSWAVAHRG